MFRSQRSRAIRREVNRNRHVGLANRQWGICKKANTFFRLYDVDIAVVMRLPDGRTGGYQSRRDLGQELFLEGGHELLGPHEVEGLARSLNSPTTSYATARNQRSTALGPPSETASSENLDTRPMEIVSPNDLAETASTLTLLAASASSTSAHQTGTPGEAPESDQAAFQRQSTDSNLDMQTHSSYNYSDMSSPLESTGQALGNDRQ
ncbi:SRF-type transcription factor family protein [Metarhizium robertsii]|uniref:SRF-type transcription factor family protein n=1 Tax=Metarhizium robertsii TaxID=568076 RepID=A0A014QRL3_9HYPO|nr:SRF-type transcription factor family protein [Metarhizium robertsii]